MVDSANVVTGFEFPRVKSLGESAEARRRGNFVACHHFCQAAYSDRNGVDPAGTGRDSIIRRIVHQILSIPSCCSINPAEDDMMYQDKLAARV
jgi:hypothetical protein